MFDCCLTFWFVWVCGLVVSFFLWVCLSLCVVWHVGLLFEGFGFFRLVVIAGLRGFARCSFCVCCGWLFCSLECVGLWLDGWLGLTCILWVF